MESLFIADIDPERMHELLTNAISVLIDEGLLNFDIKEEIGATDNEWKILMDAF